MTDAPPDYTGRRRADTHRQPRIVFVVVLIVVAAVVVALRVLPTGSPERTRLNATDANGPLVPTGLPATVQTPPSPTGSPTPSATPSPRPSRSTGSSASPTNSGSPSASPAGTTAASVSYEAEAGGNGRPSQMTIRDVSGASGGRAVTRVGNGRTLSFTGVNVPRRGDYTVTIAYLSTDDRRCFVGAGRSWDQVTFPASGAWERVATVTVTLQLNAGANTIEVGNTPGRWCPDLDRITVAPR